jgi:radical SAM protein with 4Fe4S-binding SPASM domain
MIKELDYSGDYGKRLASKQRKTGFPRNIIFEVTHRCNLRCRHCYVVPGSGKEELSTSEVRTVFDQLVEAGGLHATLTGGEPLMRKDIVTLMEYARRVGLFIHLFTNATLLTTRIADALEEFRPASVEISLHSLKEERFDWFTQVSGSYERAMKAIQLLKKRNVNLALKITVTKANVDEIGDLMTFAEEVGAAPELTAILMPRQDGSKDNIALRLEPETVVSLEAMLSREQAREEEKSWEEFLKADKDRKRKPTEGRLFQCGAGEKALSIGPCGELKPCLQLPASGYSVPAGGLKEGWKMLGDWIGSINPTESSRCFDCTLADFCSSCPAQAKLECGDLDACPPYYRRLAELTRAKQAANPETPDEDRRQSAGIT